jgi:hypothetical protein
MRSCGGGRRQPPQMSRHAIYYYDTDGNPVRNIDELGREVDSFFDGRHPVSSRTFPEECCENAD